MTSKRARLGIGAGLVALVVALGLTAVALAGHGGPPPSTVIEIDINYSKFEPSVITVPVGVPVTITIRNNDPIDHEWIVGDEAMQAFHRASSEPVHPGVSTEVMVPAGQTRVTTVTFEATGSLQYICHLPAHEAYGMVGTVTIR
ncbi:MAG: cupredoxin domain-containing protein [Candidatus Limnocylindrales bacterium]